MSKFTSKKDFTIARVVHDLKNPIAVILSSVEMLRTSKFNVSPRWELIEIIENAAKKLLNDVNTLLVSNSVYADEEICLLDLVKEILSELRTLCLSKYIETIVEIDEKIKVFADKNKLKSMFENIIGNAIKYNKFYGSLVVKLKREKDYLIFSVKDSGIGIEKNEIERIFNEFYRTDNAKKFDERAGTGIGLAIALDIVKFYNGTIEVKSEIGVGSEFIVKLPKRKFCQGD